MISACVVTGFAPDPQNLHTVAVGESGILIGFQSLMQVVAAVLGMLWAIDGQSKHVPTLTLVVASGLTYCWNPVLCHRWEIAHVPSCGITVKHVGVLPFPVFRINTAAEKHWVVWKPNATNTSRFSALCRGWACNLGSLHVFLQKTRKTGVLAVVFQLGKAWCT